MKKSKILFFVSLFFMIFVLPSFLIFTNPYVDKGWVITETRSGYSIFGGHTLRFEESNTFYLDSFKIDKNNKSATIEVVADGSDGEISTIVQPVKPANYIFYFQINENGYPSSFSMVPLLVRDNTDLESFPFNTTENDFLRNLICEQENCRFNLEKTIDFFNFNIEFIQQIQTSKGTKNLTVNVEMNTNNYESGLIERTAVHIIKRDENQKIVYRLDHTYKVVNKFQRYIRILDRDNIEIPYLFMAVWIIAEIYQVSINYIEKNNIKFLYKPKEENSEKSEKTLIENKK